MRQGSTARANAVQPISALSAVTAILLVGVVDYRTGSEISVGVFYLIPIAWLTWQFGNTIGLVSAVGSAVIWLIAEQLTSFHYSHPLLPYWNSLVRLGFFVIVVVLVNRLRDQTDLLGEMVKERTAELTFENQERRHAEAELRKKESLLRLIFNTTPAVIFVKDRESKILIANESMAAFYNLSISDVIGQRQSDLHKKLGFDQQEITKWLADDREVIETGQPKKVIETGTDSNGNVHWFETTKFPLEISEGDWGVLVVSNDVTERKKAEETIRDYTAELEKNVEERTVQLLHANRAKDEFLANMSHELRTPLNSILGLSESLMEQRQETLTDHQAKLIRIIDSSGRHLLELINDILDLSKIEAGKLTITPEIVHAGELCLASLNFVRQQAAEKHIHLEHEADSADFELSADRRRLKQILVNLLTNAVKFTPEGGRVTLEVTTDPTHEEVSFSVIDNGIGIPHEDIERLFQPFVQLDNSLSRQHQGTGLGLALVQRLAELHGGSIHVDSQPGEGSRFTVQMPWKTPSEQMQVPGPRTEAISSEGSRETIKEDSSTARKILLAEDNPSNVLTISEYLESHGHTVHIAKNGQEAIELAAEISPDMILMDVQMPVMDGLEAIRRLRADPRFATTPIIALTALAMPGDRERCLAAGANGYESKPVSLKKLNQLISELGTQT